MESPTARILVVDDEFAVRDSLTHWFRKDGYEVVAAENATIALQELQQRQFDVALVDLKMPGMDGMQLQERIYAADPEIPVVLITAYASVETAVSALKHGAFDYITKPIDPDDLTHLVRRALEQRRLREENAQLKANISDMVQDNRIVGESKPIRKVLDLISQVARSDATVLILGESGTGKELIARAIHAQSARKYFPIVPVNCGALPDDLLESELFGHEKGAFTGAQQRRKGRLEMADGGTLFLDEIGAIHPRTQVDLLRVLETKEFTRVGGSRPLRVDFRVICATNENIEEAVRAERFREDLYYRVNVFPIVAPPLRERRTDIPLLAEYMLNRLSLQMDKHMNGFTTEAMRMLVEYNWPGNVRELSNAVERAMVVGEPPWIRAEDLPLWRSGLARGHESDSLADVEKHHVHRILEREDWNISRTAEILRVDRVTVYNKIKKYGLRQAAKT